MFATLTELMMYFLVEAAAEPFGFDAARHGQAKPGMARRDQWLGFVNSSSRKFSPGRGLVTTISKSLLGRKLARRIIWRAWSMILTGSPRRRCEGNTRLEIQQT